MCLVGNCRDIGRDLGGPVALYKGALGVKLGVKARYFGVSGTLIFDRKRGFLVSGGETGIRTLEGCYTLLVFKTSAFNRSAISPTRGF